MMLNHAAITRRAKRDAAQERKQAAAQATRARNRMAGPPVAQRDDMRPPFDWCFSVSGVTWNLHFEADPRDVRRWRVWRDGEPWMVSGLEQVWRAMQREMAQPLGRRNWH
jgi:hypothetical protein